MEINEIEMSAVHEAPWESTLLLPVGDLQLGASGSDVERFKRHIDWGMQHPRVAFLGMGDYVDVASPSNRSELRGARLYDSVQDMLDEAAERQRQQFMALVAGTEGRWVGLLEGHHFFQFADGSTTDTRIAHELGTPFLGSCAFVRLVYRNGKHYTTCTIWCHHGAGSSVKASGPLNRLENLVHYFDADIYLMGHMSKKVAAPLDQLYMSGTAPYRIKHRTKIIAGTGGFLQGYQQGSARGQTARGSYVEQGMMAPVALGGVAITITPVSTSKGDSLDLKVSL